ncbi:MAG: hypothetical protein QW567_01455 [Candidatus Hadarchaeales archaeon]
MVLVHYQTMEEVGPGELRTLRGLVKHLRRFGVNMRLWRKSDLLCGLRPAGARWGHVRARCEEEIRRTIAAISLLSRALPGITWSVYVEGNGGELMLRNGRCVALR